MNEVFADRIELDGLVMLANKQHYLDRANGQQASFIAQQQAAQTASNDGRSATMPATAATEDGIINRSPTTNYHIHQAPQPAPTSVPTPSPTPTPSAGSKLPSWLIPAGIALLLATGAGGAAWYYGTRPSPPSTTNPKMPNFSPDTTIKFS